MTDRKPTLSRAFLKALAYVLGMVTMYSVLGLVAATTGSFFGEWLQNFWVQLAAGLFPFSGGSWHQSVLEDDT